MLKIDIDIISYNDINKRLFRLLQYVEKAGSYYLRVKLLSVKININISNNCDGNFAWIRRLNGEKFSVQFYCWKFFPAVKSITIETSFIWTHVNILLFINSCTESLLYWNKGLSWYEKQRIIEGAIYIASNACILFIANSL